MPDLFKTLLKRKGLTFVVFILSLIFLGCSNKEPGHFFIINAEKAGIDFQNIISETKDLTILDYLYFYNGGGVAIGDINNDDLLDIFFTGNQVKNKLYLNQGNLTFKDISAPAGIQGESDWNTGVIMGDVNGDGLLDIYVCAVVGINGLNGRNELYINNGDATFTEQASKYNLDFDGYSTSAAFLDFDLDGDLDIYLLNQAIHTQESFGNASIRNNRTYESGDRLLRNDGTHFVDVSEEAGIYGGPNGYGLGIAVSDFNKDGYPDIYIGNDFHEDDYYYVNNGDGTFSEKLKEYFGHVSKFSMGNDVSDINHDGYTDILTLDMLPNDEKTLKSSLGDESFSTFKIRVENLGYHYQYSRNMLQLNNAGNSFAEVGLQSNLAATDWSWSAMFNDYDQDGEQDLFVTNGIPKRPNDLEYVKFISNEEIKNKLSNTNLIDKEALNLMPSGAIHNVIFKGSGDLQFIDKSQEWLPNDSTISNGAAYGDLDNDGDIDIVTNNLNTYPSLYINETNEKANWLQIKLTYKGANVYGLGTQVYAYNQGILQYKELYTARGFQSSSTPILHFGFGDQKKLDSLVVIWPDQSKKVLKNIKLNQKLKIVYGESHDFISKSTVNSGNKPLFFKVEDNLGIDYAHKENYPIDFNVQKLIPFQVSDRGIATTIADINNDHQLDIIFGGSNREKGKIFIQKNGFFEVDDKNYEVLQDPIYENVEFIIEDFNGDKINDVFSINGGGLFDLELPAMQSQFFIHNDDGFIQATLPTFQINSTVGKSADFDNDGDIDVFIGGGAIPSDYGKQASSYILRNDKGSFSILNCEPLDNIGIVNDAIWTDFNNDGLKDLIVIGEWMSPVFLKNNNNDFVDVTSEIISPISGLWQTIDSFDIDNDGDTDYLLGNWGTNTKFKASKEHPLRMYYADFDDNGSTETIVCNYNDGNYYPLLGLDELASQIASLRKKFPNYKSFAGKPIDAIFEPSVLKKARILEVDNLASGYLKNENNKFTFIPFKRELQVSPVTAFLVADFNADGKKEALVGGNYFGVIPYHGRFDAFSGALIYDETHVDLGYTLGLNFSNKAIMDLNTLSLDGKSYLIVTVNNAKVEVYQFKD